MDSIITIVITIIGCSGIWELIKFLISRRDKKVDTIEVIGETIKHFEKINVEHEMAILRLQLLVLISNYPNNESEIMLVAEKYFKELNGDWYMTGIFNNFLVENKIGKPSWFNPHD